jgi:hypothetical protein
MKICGLQDPLDYSETSPNCHLSQTAISLQQPDSLLPDSFLQYNSALTNGHLSTPANRHLFLITSPTARNAVQFLWYHIFPYVTFN